MSNSFPVDTTNLPETTSPRPSRRALLRGLAAAGVVFPLTASGAALSSPGHPDAELFALRAKIDALIARHQNIHDAYTESRMAWMAEQPAKPEYRFDAADPTAP
jgi:hypothetical protein